MAMYFAKKIIRDDQIFVSEMKHLLRGSMTKDE